MVVREGSEKQINAEDLVPGDIVILEPGNKTPADIRLLQEKNLLIDESPLTGESTAVEKKTGTVKKDTPVSERTNMGFAGSTVTSGRGVGVVVAIGLHTEVGKIAKAVTTAETAKPPLLIRMEKFARQISFIVLGACALLAGVTLIKGLPFSEVFFLAIALAVSAIPEGLPVALTVALSIATSRMGRRHVIIRRLTAVESLGSCTMIASDKTGTLTVNQQTVRLILLPNGESYQISGEGYSGEGKASADSGEPLSRKDREKLESLAKAGVLCNEAILNRDNGEWKHQGNVMDVALLAVGYKLGIDPNSLRKKTDFVGEIPFESERRYAARFFRKNGDTKVALKGAVETVLDFCQTMQVEDKEIEIDKEKIGNKAIELADKGYRVLAIACGGLESRGKKKDFEEKDIPPLTFLGLAAFIDPLRPEAKDAVAECHEAGIEVAMITGDHPSTALAIARELGIARSSDDVITGEELEKIGDPGSPEFKKKAASFHVFARVTPLQKYHLVESLVESGHFVAVTGDGVNDAPALRKANIGVAMGSGTDVAKDTASMIVTDNNFTSIVAGVEEGRFAYDNVRKVTYLLISTGAAEVILFTLAISWGLPLPLFAVQILWLNLVTNGIQDVALAFEGGEPGTMKRPPRKPKEGIFNPLMIQQTLTSGLTMGLAAFGVWFWMLNSGWEQFQARNHLLLLMVLLENIHVFNCRSEYESAFRVPLRRNVVLIFGVAAAQGLHLLSLQIPLMQNVLRVEPVSLQEWGILLGLAFSILVVMEVFKALKKKRPRF